MEALFICRVILAFKQIMLQQAMAKHRNIYRCLSILKTSADLKFHQNAKDKVRTFGCVGAKIGNSFLDKVR